MCRSTEGSVRGEVTRLQDEYDRCEAEAGVDRCYVLDMQVEEALHSDAYFYDEHVTVTIKMASPRRRG